MTTWETASGLTFVHALRDRALADPGQLFCRFGSQPWHTYGDLWQDAARWSSALAGLGLRPGDRVIVFMTKRVEYLTAMVGIQAAGGVYVPVNSDYSAAELAILIEDCSPTAIITDRQLLPVTAQAAEAVPGQRAKIISVDGPEPGDPDGVTPAAGLLSSAAADVTPLAQSDQLALIMYTSGTTGKPKGVTFSHGNVMYMCLVKSAERNAPGDRGLDFFPLHHFNGGLAQIVPAMVHGASVVLQDTFSPAGFGRQLRENGITTTAINSNHVQDLLAEPESDDDRNHDCRRMSLGLKISPAMFGEFERRFGTRLLGAYGLTEAVGPFILGIMAYRTPPQSSGRPVPGYEVAVIDESGTRLGPGQPGEIIVRAQAQYAFFPGYWNDQEKTDALLHDGWLHTGDLGILDADGAFTYLQRVVDQVRRSGALVAPCLAEEVIGGHEAVAENVVVGLADDPENETLVAHVVLRPGSAAGSTEDALAAIRVLCQEQLDDRLVPDHVIAVEAVPKDILGKINKKRIRQETQGRLSTAGA
jgi:acyl-CoA synthetase (AMP-forming)/AMP-acid ligase II